MPHWEEKAREERDRRDAELKKIQPPLFFPKEKLPLHSQDLPQQLLTAREYDITQNNDVATLLRKLKIRELTAEEVARAFLRRAAIAQYATNCLTDLMWDEAVERAKYLDSLSEPLGPLHGLPVSVKEHQGMHIYKKKTNVAYVSWIGDESPHSPMNENLWNAGCVFYARTNQPQTLQCLETINNIYGRTVNPWNRNLSPGGSSGGESALLAMRGSLLGLGGDIGGSVRAPAGNCGIYGFKPTAKRLGVSGMKATMGGGEGLLATFGPLSTDREALELFMKTVLDTKPWRIDPSLDPRPWQPVTLEGKLKVAVMWSDGVVKPHPPVTRALREVSEACKKAGMNVVDWNPLGHEGAWDLYVSLLYPDGGAAAREPLEDIGEPLLPLTKWMTCDQPAAKQRTIHEYWAIVMEREAYRNAYAAHWNETSGDHGQEVDVILCPAGPNAAPLHDTSKYWPYTCHWNLLDYPAVVFPVTFVDPAKDVKEVHFSPLNDQDARNYDLYEPEKFVGAPVSLQVVGRRGMDEKLVAALKEIESAMGRQ